MSSHYSIAYKVSNVSQTTVVLKKIMANEVEKLMFSIYGNKSISQNEIDKNDPEYLSIKQSLSCLSRHPILLKHCLIQLKAKSKELKTIEPIKHFPLLMYVDISDNSVSDIGVLEYLPTLVQLDASRNEIESCLDFSPPQCVMNNSWSNGGHALGSLLVRANLSFNKIKTLEDLSHHPFLECLILSNNQISRINGLESLKYIQVLDLSYNKITEVQGLSNLPIQELNLRGNLLSTLEGLTNLPYLSSLDISDNQISCLSPLEQCHQLHFLNIQHNQIAHIRQIEFLKDLQWLRVLHMSENPASEKHYYRLRVIIILINLTQLDGVVISAQEKIQSMNLKNDEKGDNDHRSTTFARYFPDTFVPEAVLSDTLNEFMDEEDDLTLEDLLKS